MAFRSVIGAINAIMCFRTVFHMSTDDVDELAVYDRKLAELGVRGCYFGAYNTGNGLPQYFMDHADFQEVCKRFEERIAACCAQTIALQRDNCEALQEFERMESAPPMLQNNGAFLEKQVQLQSRIDQNDASIHTAAVQRFVHKMSLALHMQQNTPVDAAVHLRRCEEILDEKLRVLYEARRMKELRP